MKSHKQLSIDLKASIKQVHTSACAGHRTPGATSSSRARWARVAGIIWRSRRNVRLQRKNATNRFNCIPVAQRSAHILYATHHVADIACEGCGRSQNCSGGRDVCIRKCRLRPGRAVASVRCAHSSILVLERRICMGLIGQNTKRYLLALYF